MAPALQLTDSLVELASYQTGRIPEQMVALFCSPRCGQVPWTISDEGLPDALMLGLFARFSADCFRYRTRSLLKHQLEQISQAKKGQHSAAHLEAVAAFQASCKLIAELLCNAQVEFVPEPWKTLGLFVSRDGLNQPACPAVWTAVLRATIEHTFSGIIPTVVRAFIALFGR